MAQKKQVKKKIKSGVRGKSILDSPAGLYKKESMRRFSKDAKNLSSMKSKVEKDYNKLLKEMRKMADAKPAMMKKVSKASLAKRGSSSDIAIEAIGLD